jgi:hypothetical protein
MKMKAMVQVVSATGSVDAPKEVEVEATVTVGVVLRAAGVALSNKVKLMLGGKPVNEGDIVTEGATLTVTEKPAGS